MPSRFARPLSLLLIAAVVAAAFLPALSAGLFMEDHHFVRTIDAEGGLARTIADTHGNWLGFAGYPYYRPLVTATFAIDHAIWGTAPFGYHVTNLVLHALNAWLVAVLVLALLPGAGHVGATLAAAFYAVLPVHPNAVGWIAARSDLLVGAATLATLVAFHRAWTRPGGRGRALGTGAFAAALLSKESGVVALVLVALLPVAIPWRTRARGLIGPLVALVVYAGVRLAFVRSTIDLHVDAGTTSLAAIAASLSHQLREVVLPSTGPAWLAVPLAAIALCALPTAVRRPGLVAWCAALGVLSLAPLVPIAANLDPAVFAGYSRYWYVAAVAFAVVVAMAVRAVAGWPRAVVVAAAALVVVVHTTTTRRACVDELVRPAAVADAVARAIADAPAGPDGVDLLRIAPDAHYGGVRMTPLAFTAATRAPLFPVDDVSLAWIVGRMGGFRPLRLFAVDPAGRPVVVRALPAVARWRETLPDGPFRFDLGAAVDVDGGGRSPQSFEIVTLDGIRGAGTFDVHVEYARADGSIGVATRSLAVNRDGASATATFRDDLDVLTAATVRTIRIERTRPPGVVGGERASALSRVVTVDRIAIGDRPTRDAIDGPAAGATVAAETLRVRWRPDAPRQLAVRTLGALGLSPGLAERPLRPIDGVPDRLRRELAVTATLGHGRVWWLLGDADDRERYAPVPLDVRPSPPSGVPR